MISFTEEALTKVKEFLSKSKEGTALRVSITRRAEDGFSYHFTLEHYSAERQNDVIVREGGFATRIDAESAKFMKGATIKWVTDKGHEGFGVDNPNKSIPEESSEALESQILDAIKTIYDPEIPRVNIYDLGLIYKVEVTGEKIANIQMTLTAPNCPAAEQLPADVERKSRAVPGIKDVKLELTFEPPWTPERMTEAAKLELNIL